jgi:peptidoglycan-associated lipoprotein
MVLFLSMGLLNGCAKKAALREETAITQEKAAAKVPATVTADDREAGKRALREERVRNKAAREKAEKEAAEMAAKEVYERAKREAAEKAARAMAILQELQIADIRFDFDKYNLKPEAQSILKAGAPAYLKYPIYKLMIEGHCDEHGTVEYNLVLGQKRADEAAQYLIDLGIQKDRIKTITYGEERPVDNGHDEKAWAKNRRDHFVVSQPVE